MRVVESPLLGAPSSSTELALLTVVHTFSPRTPTVSAKHGCCHPRARQGRRSARECPSHCDAGVHIPVNVCVPSAAAYFYGELKEVLLGVGDIGYMAFVSPTL